MGLLLLGRRLWPIRRPGLLHKIQGCLQEGDFLVARKAVILLNDCSDGSETIRLLAFPKTL